MCSVPRYSCRYNSASSLARMMTRRARSVNRLNIALTSGYRRMYVRGSRALQGTLKTAQIPVSGDLIRILANRGQFTSFNFNPILTQNSLFFNKLLQNFHAGFSSPKRGLHAACHPFTLPALTVFSKGGLMETLLTGGSSLSYNKMPERQGQGSPNPFYLEASKARRI